MQIMDRRMESLLMRGVEALEKLAADEPLEINIETKPPVCPYCEKINPMVRVDESNTTGQLAEYVVQAQCLHCNNVFYVIPFHVDCVKSIDQAQRLIEEKMRLGGYERENQGAAVGQDEVGAGSL